MKKVILSFALMSSLFISCGDDDTADTADIIINDNSITTNNSTTGSGNTQGQTINLSGTYVEDLTLDIINTYIVNGPMIMVDGTTLTIPAGMTIEALAAGSDVYVAISQGAKIIANGTSSDPIVFTSNSSAPQAGDWGGLILLGKAPINSVTGGTETATSEIGGLAYGGDQPTDNSGSLTYVRVQYSGGKADGSSENNGFSFYGVGSGTTVQYIQMYEGLDDGLEFFGGTVNASYVSVINAQDDSIDWTEGYSGVITNAYIKHGSSHDKGIEADGYNTDIGNNSSPVFFSNPTIENLTIVGLGSGTGNEAIRLRAGTSVKFINVSLEGFTEGFDIDTNDNFPTETGNSIVAGISSVTNISFTDVTLKLKNDTTVSFNESDFISGDGNGTGTDYTTWGAGWTVE